MTKADLSVVERKVLGALLNMVDDEMKVKARLHDIAQKMGYKDGGGVITYALKVLDMKNYINITSKNNYQVLI